MKENKRKCVKCGRSPATDPDTKLFRFPIPGITNTFRCESWAMYCFPEKEWSSIEFQKKLYSEHRMLCNRHFKETSFSDWPDSMKKLHKFAIPEVFTHQEKQTVPQNKDQPGPSCRETETLRDMTNFPSTSSQVTAVECDFVQLPTSTAESIPTSSGVSNKRPLSVRLPEDAVIAEPIEKQQKKKQTVPQNKDQPGPSCRETETLRDMTNFPSTSSQVTAVECDFVQLPTSTAESIPTSSGVSNERPLSVRLPEDAVIAEPIEKQQKKDNKSKQTAKERKYYLKSRKYFKTICNLRNRIKKYKGKDQLHIISNDDTIKKLERKISPSLALLLQGEIKNFSKKPKGRRWTTDEKILALRIYKRSPTCYRLLRRMFCLPAPSSLKKLLSFFGMQPGINKKVMAPLKKFVKGLKPSENQFTVMFDEISIKKHLYYNKKEDCIEGFQDHGEHGRTNQEAVKALVFMLAGIRKGIKQPLSYYLSSANVTGDRLSVLIKETIRECFNAGIQVAATVCDMGGTNRRSLAMLGATAQRPIIKVDDKEIVTLFDTPHLLKCFRNNFLKYDIKCKASISSSGIRGEGVARWSDIKTFFEIDSANANFVFAPSLKKEHLEPNTKQKMKVNLAAQVLSHTVAAGILAKLAQGVMPASAAITADIISNMDKLFDLVNSDTSDCRSGKPYATNMSKKSPHADHFKKMKLFFKELEFVGCARPPPCLEGWVWTMNGLEYLWNEFQKFEDVHSLSTRRLQQDPLENLFGCIRGNCGSNVNPTTSAFIGGMKTAVMSNLTHISTGNCEKDDNVSIINNIKSLLSSCQPATTSTRCDSPLLPLFEAAIDLEMLDAAINEDSGETQACAYVCGFLIKNHKLLSKCSECQKNFSQDEISKIHIFIENKEYSDFKKSLKYSSRQFVTAVEACAVSINKMLNEDASKKNLKHNSTQSINNKIFDFIISCQEHFEDNVKYIKSSVFHICVKRFCTIKNRKFSEEASHLALKRKMLILKNQ